MEQFHLHSRLQAIFLNLQLAVQNLGLHFRLDALAKALSVIATATWLAGWLADWVSVTAGIVSKRQNLSENFLDHLVGPSVF